MKPEVFYTPGALRVERQTPREGPSPVFVAWKPHTAATFTDVKALESEHPFTRLKDAATTKQRYAEVLNRMSIAEAKGPPG